MKTQACWMTVLVSVLSSSAFATQASREFVCKSENLNGAIVVRDDGQTPPTLSFRDLQGRPLPTNAASALHKQHLVSSQFQAYFTDATPYVFQVAESQGVTPSQVAAIDVYSFTIANFQMVSVIEFYDHHNKNLGQIYSQNRFPEACSR